MTVRIKLDPAHTEISLAGHNYKVDSTGAFEVPAEFVAELQRVHGAVIEPGEQQLRADLIAAERNVAAAKAQLAQQENTVAVAKAALDGFLARLKPSAATSSVGQNGSKGKDSK